MVQRAVQRSLRVVIFCGGRGSATIVRELTRHPDLDVTLLVNAYDDGLSTGALRELIPGLLGPSDFRKNLSYLVDPYSAEQYALQQILEFRMPSSYGLIGLRGLDRLAARDELTRDLPPQLASQIAILRSETRRRIRGLVASFVEYATERGAVDVADFAFGNLLFAGAYLEHGNDFNAAVATLADLFNSQATILNVSDGEVRTLVGLKSDGTILGREAEIVGTQSDVPIAEFYFLSGPLTPQQRGELEGLTVDERKEWLKAREMAVAVSPEADTAIRQADIVLYGPGTQHSSLLPSYAIAHEAIESSEAFKVWIGNLETDLDIAGLGVLDLVDNAMRHLHDLDNTRGLIDAILVNEPTEPTDLALDVTRLGSDGTYHGVAVVRGCFRNPSKPSRHSGHEIVLTVLDLYQKTARGGANALEIYVDLKQRDLALRGVLEEFAEIDWLRRVDRVRLVVNTQEPVDIELPSHLEVVTVRHRQRFSEVGVFLSWLGAPGPAYLATLTGDGEYRFRDVFAALGLLERGGFGAVFGSRSQSRRRFASSVLAEHGENGSLRRLSAVSSLIATLCIAARTQVVFSDPFTGFRVYGRARMPVAADLHIRLQRATTATELAGVLIANGVEVTEIPVTYRTYAGFTDPAWRIRRGVANLLGALRW